MDEQRTRAIVSLAEALLGAPAEKRHDLLARLKERYVRCDDDRCTTDPDVAQVVLPYAVDALEAPSAEARIAGIEVIELLAPDAYHLLPKLGRALSDPVPEVRVAALGALGEFGPDAVTAATGAAEQSEQ